MINGTLFGIGAVLAILATTKVLFPNAKLFILIEGFFSGWVEDKTKTPDGAKAVYNKKIQELQESYNKANDTLQKVTGRKMTIQKELDIYTEELATIEKNCEALAKKQMFDKIEPLSERREDVLLEIEQRKHILEELIPQVEEAKMINTKLQENLSNMKKEKERILRELETKKQMKEIYDEMDELKNVSTTNQMINTVREGVKELSEQAEGAKEIYNNKKSTKYERAKEEAQKAISSNYVEELKKKYGNTSTKVNGTEVEKQKVTVKA
jgi:phage shock protein A